ncbi:SH3 domain-containing protein [Pantanalinema rosaneae CENA516]|uniref:SH3 domain-containing protein n=1 Tax=Pantanalinema rosaneae TaxID=1620701 RepID=UPI003D6EEBC4
MKHNPKAFGVGVGAAVLSAIAGMSLLVWQRHTSQTTAAAMVCQTIATDPNPPLNVRSSPVVASDNIIGKINNGTLLTVVDENQGWLRISTPTDGWVYKEYTVTSCVLPTEAQLSGAISPISDQGNRAFATATEHYQNGNLTAAIALAKMVPADSPIYPDAQTALNQWQQDWQRAEAQFYKAQTALRDGRWQDVMNTVKDFPENRFWKAKLTPIVRQAIQVQAQKTNSGLEARSKH